MIDLVVIGDRRVPERHDAITHVLVDRALALKDDAGHGREETVDQVDQSHRIAPELLGNRREAADIGEQQRHVAHLPAQLKAVGILGQLFDHGRRQILRKRTTHLLLLLLFTHVVHESQEHVEDEGTDQGIEETEKLVLHAEQVPGAVDQPGIDRRHRKQAPNGAAKRQQDHDQHRCHNDGAQLDQNCFGITLEENPREDVLENLRMDLHTRKRIGQGCGSNVLQTCGRGAENHNVILQCCRRSRAVENILGRDITITGVGGVVDPGMPVLIGRKGKLRPHIDGFCAGGVVLHEHGKLLPA